MSSKNLSRCMILALAILFIIAAMPSLAQAQVVLHGVAITKGCNVVRACDTDADCDDGNLCTNDVCDQTLPNIATCEIRTDYNDDAGDTVRIDNLSDQLFCTDGGQGCPIITANPDIVIVSGNTTCTVGPFTPCLIGPSGSTLNGLPGTAGDGAVTYQVTGYNPILTDIPQIRDEATINVFDLCDSGIDTQACVAAPNRSATTEFSTVVVDECTSTPQPSLNDGCPDDGNPCTQSGCNEAGECDPNHVITPSLNDACPDDGLGCTESGCNAAGECVFDHVVTPSLEAACPDDGNPCTQSGCNDAGQCDPNHVITPSLNGTQSGCNDAGVCVFDHVITPSLNAACPDDGNPCTQSGCNDAGQCDPNHVITPSLNDGCPDDGVECTQSGCNEAGVCVTDHIDECVEEEICRTPGFWGTHACRQLIEDGQIVAEFCDYEKDNPKNPAHNLTQAVIDAASGCLEVCGEVITNTAMFSADSALEAICSTGSNGMVNAALGYNVNQLSRQLTAAALNCVISGDTSGTCAGISIQPIFTECNNLCESFFVNGNNANANGLSVSECIIDRIDCFNNGGQWNELVGCYTGTCPDGTLCGEDAGGCADGSECDTSGSCHDRELCNPAIDVCLDANKAGIDCDAPDAPEVCYGKHGPAGSGKACNAVKQRGDECLILEPWELNC
ncbi:MAG: hypothetical protein ACYTEW_27455, partial [Planctomycetota bacterium]